MVLERAWTVAARGVGAPDHTSEVSSSIQRAGLLFDYQERIQGLGAVYTDQVAHPYLIPWVLPVVASGATSRLVDVTTGAVTITTPAGYAANLIQFEWTNSEEIEIWIWIDTMLVSCPTFSSSGENQGWNVVLPFSSLGIDPTAASAHLWDITVINRGAGNLEGAVGFYFILEPWGTEPLPTTKDCHCPFCHHIQTVPVDTTRITCAKCGELYIVRVFPARKR